MRGSRRAVAISMGLGAVYDLAFAGAMIFFPVAASRMLGLPIPDDPTYLGLAGVLLVVLAGMYALAASDIRRYRGIVVVAIVGRSLGAIYLGCAAWSHGRAPAFAATALADLAFALAHTVLLVRASPEDAPS